MKLAKGYGVELTAQEAEAYLSEMEDIDLDSSQMKKVAGGACYDKDGDECWSLCAVHKDQHS